MRKVMSLLSILFVTLLLFAGLTKNVNAASTNCWSQNITEGHNCGANDNYDCNRYTIVNSKAECAALDGCYEKAEAASLIMHICYLKEAANAASSHFNDTTNVATIADLGVIVVKIIGLALGLAGVVLFILLIVGGFKFITSGGDPKALEGAKSTLTHAVLGLVIVLGTYLILVLIKTITGADVTNFSITLPQ